MNNNELRKRIRQLRDKAANSLDEKEAIRCWIQVVELLKILTRQI